MDCKNCNTKLEEVSRFCHYCGAKVVEKRLTLNMLIGSFVNKVFGFDNTYFRTFRTMITNPEIVIDCYITGIRKRYMSPITFLVIGLTLSTLVFNIFSNQYIQYNTFLTDYAENHSFAEGGANKSSNTLSQEERNLQIEKQTKVALKYFNLLGFLSMPLYTLIALFVFNGKKYNFSEHLVINSYLQGLSMIVTTSFFVIGIYTHQAIYFISVFITVFYYLITYKRLCHLGWKKTVWKFFKFLIALLLIFLVTSIIILTFSVINK